MSNTETTTAFSSQSAEDHFFDSLQAFAAFLNLVISVGQNADDSSYSRETYCYQMSLV